MKVLHCSDAHADKSLLGTPRFAEIERAFEQTVRTAVDERVDLWAFTGDLCDPDDGPLLIRCVDLAQRVSRDLVAHGVTNFWLPGNHDVTFDGGPLTTLSLIRCGDPLVRVFERASNVLHGGVCVLALPYAVGPNAYDPVAEVRSFRQQPALSSSLPVLVLTHLSIAGAKVGDETTEMARGRDIAFPWEETDPDWVVLGGHYHRRQVVMGPGNRRIHVAGGMARYTFGEESNIPAYTVLEVG